MKHASHARGASKGRGARQAGQAAVMATAVFLAACLTPTAFAGIEEGRQKAQVCAACHGADGNSVITNTPSLAGQPRQFIVTALFMFREGRRVNEQMTPFVQKLSNTDLNDLAAYFSSQKMAPPARKPEPEVVAKGQEITRRNNCVACHTATLVGQQHIPRIAGQHRDYLLTQLRLFKAAKRADFDGTMTSAAQALTPEEIDLLADYLSTISLP